MLGIGFNQRTHALPQHRTNENVGVKHQGSGEGHERWRFLVRHALKSVTSSSSVTPDSSSKRSNRSAASLSAALSAAVRFGRAGMKNPTVSPWRVIAIGVSASSKY